MNFFLSRRWRPNKWPFFVLLGIELPLTVALLALFGIAAPNLYRTKLWQDGADNGFNSSPLTGLYAAANYKPYKTPKVWASFITNYNIVISVLSMFIMLVKSVMYMLHVFPPILSAIVHSMIVALYAVSVAYQSSSDTSDPKHPQHGAPWYITKSCSVTHDPKLVGYCKQAKASFATTCTALALFAVYLCIAIFSCFPSKTQRIEYAMRQSQKAEKYARFEMGDSPKSGSSVAYPVPHTPGLQSGLNPMTPRTMAFNTLGGTRDLDLPLRATTATGNGNGSAQNTSPTNGHTQTAASFALRSPEFPRSPMSVGFVDQAGRGDTPVGNGKAAERIQVPGPDAAPKLFFPPPPKSSKKK